MGVAQMPRNVLNKILLLAVLTPKNHPETISLNVVLVRDGDLLRKDGADPFLMLLTRLDELVVQRTERGGVVRISAVVSVDGHGAVAVERGEGGQRTIDRDLVGVGAESVAMGVGVGEETGLEDRVGGGLDAGHHVGRREGGLLDFGEVVLWVPVEGEAAETAEGDLVLGPDFGEVEDVPAEFLGRGRAECLNVACPGGEIVALDSAVKVLGVPVWVVRGKLGGFFVSECLAALVGFAVDLDIVEVAVGLDPFVGVA